MEYLFASCVTSDMVNRLQQDGRAGIADGVFHPRCAAQHEPDKVRGRTDVP
jgi:hypothetical protein